MDVLSDPAPASTRQYRRLQFYIIFIYFSCYCVVDYRALPRLVSFVLLPENNCRVIVSVDPMFIPSLLAGTDKWQESQKQGIKSPKK